MKITIDVRWPRWLQARRRRTKVVIAGLVAAGIVAVPVAWASHDFTDVPTGHPFHSQISAVKTAGITGGKTCVPPGTPPTYCPGEAITREAMAAFVQRGMGRIGQDSSGTIAVPQSFTGVEIEEEDMIVPGVSGTQYVLVQGWATLDDGPFTGTCEIALRLIQDVAGTAVVSPEAITHIQSSDTNVDQTISISFGFVATSGVHDYSMQVVDWNGCTGDSDPTNFNFQNATVTVTTFPFSKFADGGVELSPPPPAQAPEGQ